MITKQNAVGILSVNDEIKNNELFRDSNLSDLDFDDLKLNIIDLKTGEILFRQGDSASSIYLIVEGEINLIQKQSFGKINSNLSKNNFFGHVEYFLQTNRNSIAIALKDSCIAELSKENIEMLLSRDNSILNNVINSNSNLDLASISKFENAIMELPGFDDKPSKVLPIEFKTVYNDKSQQSFKTEIPIISNSNLPGYDKINVNKTKPEISKTNIKSGDEILGPKKTAEDYNNTENDLDSSIVDLKFQLSKANARLILSSQQVKKQIRLVEIKEKENLDLQKNLEDLKNTLKKKNNTINDLDNIITQLKNELSGENKLKEEFNSRKTEHAASTDAYNVLRNENSSLSEQIKNLKLQIGEVKKESSNRLIVNDELNKLKSEVEKYKQSIIERDKLIKDQKEQFENVGLVNSGALKAIASVKTSYSDKLIKKDNEIAELIDKLGNIQRALDEKTIFENQQAQTIDNQVQKITELELLVNKSSVKNNKPIIKAENVLINDSAGTNSGEQPQSNETDEIFSKCKLIKTKSVDASYTDGTFQHFQTLDINIVHVNVTRATVDVATIFNEFLLEIISREKNKIIVNLLDCEFIDSSILGSLVSSLKKVTALGGDLRLVGFHPAVHSMMELTRMLRLFEHFPTLEEAIESFK